MGNFNDTTPYTAEKSQLADTAQISAEKPNGIANMYWVFNTYNVTQPITTNVVANPVPGTPSSCNYANGSIASLCYDQSTTGTFSLNYVAPFMPPGTTFNFTLSVCNNQGTQCAGSDPVAASMP